MIFGKYGDWRQMAALVCTFLLAPGNLPVLKAQQASAAKPDAAAATTAEKAKPRSPEQLDSVVAPLALYPDPLLAQVLAASTYPLEIVQCARWQKANPKLAGEELTKAAAKQPWDASVQALVAFPAALKLLDENLQWTTDLGNAFLDQQSEVMDAVQRMRKKAKDGGKLESTKQQNVQVTTIENKQVIEIKPADPQVIYVPSYSPTVVYGPPVYAYPPIAYPTYSTGAVVATAAVSFGVGVMMGAMWSGCCHSGYGWGMGWHGGGNNDITINNNFHQRNGYANVSGGNRTNVSGGNRVNAQGGNSWQHNPQHRGSVPYSDRSSQKFGDSNRGGRDLGNQASNRDLGGSRDGSRDASRDRGQSGARDGGAGQDRVGDRNVGRDSGSRQSAFSGAESRGRSDAASNRGFSSSRQSSSGGSSARSSSSYGGGGRSGGGRSGGGRSGGGGRRR
jgi:hypothetical protein